MAVTILHVLGQELRLDCDPMEARRLTDLAAALDARLRGAALDDADGVRRIALTALALMDEAQSAAAALARAHGEIDRLNELLLDSAPLPAR